MEGREGREPLSRDDPRHQEALEKVGEIMAKFFDPKRTDGTDEDGGSTDEGEESEED